MKKKLTTYLPRQVGLGGAVLLGLGSILGTGVFVCIAISATVAGPSVILAVAVAAMVATCNGLSSAQLAANHPVSGGCYEYGYRYLNAPLGFLAGWLFLWAKSASAAAAALGFASYLLRVLNIQTNHDVVVRTVIALLVVGGVMAVVLSGLRRTNRVNLIIVSLVVSALLLFVFAGIVKMFSLEQLKLTPFFASTDESVGFGSNGFFEACALMFVAYTGYGRIATLGEEVCRPRWTIPRAIILTLIISAILYGLVAFVCVATVGVAGMKQALLADGAVLEAVAIRFDFPGLKLIVALSAILAMVGVLLNLILGLSRVLMAMGRRGDMPVRTGQLNASGTTPVVAVVCVSVVIAALVLIGDVRIVWSFSAFMVLVYYGIANACALRIKREDCLYPRFVAWCGLGACLFLAFWVETRIWLVGAGLLIIGLAWYWVRCGWRRRKGLKEQ